MTQRATCDLLHRIRAKGPGPGGCKFLCCDSRQCLFKVESAGQMFCVLEKPGDENQ